MRVNTKNAWAVEDGCVAFIGAGGKTTTMLALGGALARSGRRVLITTTTKIWPPDGALLVCSDEERDLLSTLSKRFRHAPVVTVGSGLGDRGKLQGVEPEVVCRILSSCVADVVLCEADGAAGKALKWHKEGEPVVPECSTSVFSIAGLDAIGLRVRDVHRADLFGSALGLGEHHVIGPVEMARALKATEVYAPLGSRLTYVLNKANDEQTTSLAHQVARCLRELGVTERILVTRRGEIRDVLLEASATTSFKT